MREAFHRHIAAVAILLSASGAVLAQSADDPAMQRANEQQVNEAPSATDAAPASTPEPKPLTGADLLQAALAAELKGKDLVVAEALRALVATKLSRSIERRQDRAAVEAFYRDRGFAPLWIAAGAASARAKAAAAFLRGAERDGLNPLDYPVPAFAAGDDAKLAQDELALTNAVLTYARHARTGRVSFSRVSGAIFYELEFPEAADVLAHMANAADIDEALSAYQPQHAGYKALKAKLAEARARKNAKLADTLIANMERWRWLPRELGESNVIVNIPDYTLTVASKGKTVWSTRIVVGKPGTHATPLISDAIKFITVNPTWNVPPSIIRNEYLPALQRDPNALARIGLKVGHNKDGTIRVYQPPGERNALGRIRFNFPNKFLVYQHDTPDKHLFAHDKRAYSHGCMRVQHPEKYAEVLLSIAQPDANYTADRIRRMYGTAERTITFKTPIPVHLTYQTAFVDGAGALQTRPDIYGHDRDVLNLLRNGRGVADTPVARNYHSSSKPVVARLPSRPDDYARERGWDVFGSRDERLVRQFEFGGSTFYAPRRPYGAPY